MSELFNELTVIEQDQDRIDSINRLQQAFNEVKNGYQYEYNQSVSHMVGEIKSKMKMNTSMVRAVNSFVDKYVENPSKKSAAKDEMYGILSAEMMSMLQALKHTTCIIC